MLGCCIPILFSFFGVNNNVRNFLNTNESDELQNKRISTNSLIDELEANFNSIENNLYLNIDISSSLDYENDYYNYDKKPTEHLKLSPYIRSNAIFNVLDLKNVYLQDANKFSINDAHDILLNANTLVEIKSSSYKVELKNKLYDSGSALVTQKASTLDVQLQLTNEKLIDIDYCKILKVDLTSILFNTSRNLIHNNYKYFNPNNNAYPSAILYFKTYFNKNNKFILNQPRSIYFAYDFNFEKLLSLQINNFSNNPNDIFITPPTITLNFDWDKLLVIRRLSHEYINNINNSNNFYYYFLWTKLIPLYFINNNITASLTNGEVTNRITLWENNIFITNELIIQNNSNKQINTLTNFKELKNGSSFKEEILFNNSFSDITSISYKNNEIIFNFVCRPSFLKIENYLEMKDILLLSWNRYASELVDEYKNIYDTKGMLDFLNSQIRIKEGKLFSEVFTFNDINFDKFINFDSDIKKWGIEIFNNNYYLPTYNENGQIFFLVKIKNWKFNNDFDYDAFQGDYSKDFKHKLIQHDNFIYLNQKDHFSNDGYFIVKVLTNKIISIVDENDSHTFWKLNSVSNLSKIKEHFLNSSSYITTLANNSDFVFTTQTYLTSINKELNINMALDNPIVLDYFNANKNNFGNPVNNILAMIYTLPLNSAASDENKIVLKNNDTYFLNDKYKLDIKSLISNKFEIYISNTNNNKFDFVLSTQEMLDLLYNTLNQNELSSIDNITNIYKTTNKVINWYFILFIILLLIVIGLLIVFVYKKSMLIIKEKRHK